MIYDISLWRSARERQLVLEQLVLQAYKNEITDWCGHDLACELTAQKTGVSETEVRRLVCAAGSMWS